MTFDNSEQEKIFIAARNGTLGDTSQLSKLRVDQLFEVSESWLARAGESTDGRGTKAIIAILGMIARQIKKRYETSTAKAAPKPVVVKETVVP